MVDNIGRLQVGPVDGLKLPGIEMDIYMV